MNINNYLEIASKFSSDKIENERDKLVENTMKVKR